MPITIGNSKGNLKRKYVEKNKPHPSQEVQEKEAAFKVKHGREPASDSEIDEVYGAGSATKAMDKAYEKMKRK